MLLHIETARSIAALAALMSLPVAAEAATLAVLPPNTGSAAAPSVVCGVAEPPRIIAAWAPEVPSFLAARDPGAAYGKASVAVTLDERGNIVATRLFESSGTLLLDREALISARLSRYSPKRNLCSTHGGSYIVDVDFDSSQERR